MEIFFFGGATNQAGKAGGAQASHGGQPKAAARSEPSGARRSAAPPGRRVRDRLSPARLPDRLTAIRSSPGLELLHGKCHPPPGLSFPDSPLRRLAMASPMRPSWGPGPPVDRGIGRPGDSASRAPPPRLTEAAVALFPHEDGSWRMED